MPQKSTTQLVFWSVIWTALTLASAPSMAAETAVSGRKSKTISFKDAQALDEITRSDKLKQIETSIEAKLITQGSRTDKLVVAAQFDSNSYGNSADIYIYDVGSELISDFNYDGFYHRFSVTIDADTVYASAFVYVKIYLSYEGGPWNYYATSDAYDIYGDSESDRFTIETELVESFPTGYYDIRIELYDAYHATRLDTYGPYDDAALLELPLEDSYHDDDYAARYPVETEIVLVSQSAGAMSWLLLLLPVISFFSRRLSNASR